MADLQKEVTVLGAKRLDFKNGDDEIKGVSVWYHLQEVNEENVVGIIPTKAWLPLDSFRDFQKIDSYPALALCGMDVDIQKGKLKPVSFDFEG